MSLLETVKSPKDLQQLSKEQLETLAQEIRESIINTTSVNGGHIGPNLGVVELTLALHRTFNSPEDHFVFDVAHQGYVHKLLTGRQGEKFKNIRKTGGLSGFLSRDESPYDCYGAGHAGTALSAALGMAKARDLRGGKEHVVAVIGDAALTCGITMEAMNNIVTTTKRLVVVLNDNEWSIAKNVGGIAKYLNEMITNPVYNRLHQDVESFLNKIPYGGKIRKFGSKAKQEAKDFIVSSSLFEKYGLRYLGPIDGHDQALVEQYLEFAKKSDEPILLHVLTKKGKGYDVAIKNPQKFHGTGPFNVENGESIKGNTGTPPNYQDVLGKALTKFAKEDPHIVGITAAMPSGTGLNHLAKEVPSQFVDVGIAEEHAVLFAAGMATKGIKPVCAIYSTFLQRGFDPIIHDVCLQNLPVVFCMDRAGLSPNDGPTHHGLFDISYLRCVPQTIVMQPKDEDELVDMLYSGINYQKPTFIRYPRGAAVGTSIKDKPEKIEIGKAEILEEGTDIVFWALGPMIADAKKLAEKFRETGISAGVVNARFAKPLDSELLCKQARDAKLIVTLEDHVIEGGFGSAVLETLSENEISVPVTRIGWPDQFVAHGSSVAQLRSENGLSFEDMYAKVESAFEKAAEKTEVLETAAFAQ